MIFLNLFLAILLENFNSEEELNDDKAEILNFASSAKTYITNIFDKIVDCCNKRFRNTVKIDANYESNFSNSINNESIEN